MRLGHRELQKMLHSRRSAERAFQVAAVSALMFAIGSLGLLLIDVFLNGIGKLDWQFITSFPSRKPEEAGILSALVGSAYLMALTGLAAFPIGVGTALYLEEYAKDHWFSRLAEVNIANLAGVPSILYGLLGLELFVRSMGLGRTLLAGGLTMALLVLPIVILSAREALRAVPPSIKEASFALGATQWQTIWHQVLPMAFPGMLTGAILAFSRAIGEAAPMITVGALAYIAFLPDGPGSAFTVMPIQIFNWISRPQRGFAECAAAGIMVLLAVLLLMNALAVWLRHRTQRRFSL